MSDLKLWADYNTPEEYDESTAEYNLREDVQVCKEEIAALRAENDELKGRLKRWQQQHNQVGSKHQYQRLVDENTSLKNYFKYLGNQHVAMDSFEIDICIHDALKGVILKL